MNRFYHMTVSETSDVCFADMLYLFLVLLLNFDIYFVYYLRSIDNCFYLIYNEGQILYLIRDLRTFTNYI